MASQMHRGLLEAVLVAAVLVCCAHAIERPKLPRGGDMGEVVSAAAASDAFPMEGLLMRLSPRQGRSPYWPLRHPALENARKRQRTMESFQPPQVRFFNSFADFGAGGGGGPYVDDSGPPTSALDEPKAIMDNRIKDRPLSKAMSAEDLIRALQEKALRQQSEEDGLPAGAIRFGGMFGRK